LMGKMVDRPNSVQCEDSRSGGNVRLGGWDNNLGGAQLTVVRDTKKKKKNKHQNKKKKKNGLRKNGEVG